MGRNTFVISLISVIFFVLLILFPVEYAFGYVDTVHMSVTSYAGARLFSNYYPDSEIMTTYLDWIALGSFNEDNGDVVFGYPVGEQPGWQRTIPHFWDADMGPVDPVTVYGTGLEEWPNSWQKISFDGVGDYHQIWPFMGLWDQALYYYRLGGDNKAIAYDRLGRICHLFRI